MIYHMEYEVKQAQAYKNAKVQVVDNFSQFLILLTIHSVLCIFLKTSHPGSQQWLLR